MYMGVLELKMRAAGDGAHGKLYLGTDMSALQVRRW